MFSPALALQKDLYARFVLIDDQIDAASKASWLGIGLGQPREPVAEFVMAGAVDHFCVAALPCHEALARQQTVERGGR